MESDAEHLIESIELAIETLAWLQGNDWSRELLDKAFADLQNALQAALTEAQDLSLLLEREV
jgi:hypothetical protein